MTYPEKPLPPVSVELDHEREILEAVDVVTASDPGTVGAVASTAIDVVAVVVPFAFVAVIVYIVVEVGFTDVDPMSVLVLKPPGVMATELAFVMFHESVDVPAEATMLGDELNDDTEGKSPFVVVPDETVDDAEVLPTLSLAVV
jgi:hypothetical protein